MSRTTIDRPFLVMVVTLVVLGFFIFTSASLGLLARDGASFSSVAFSQIFLGIVLGTIALLINTRIHYHFFKRYSLFIFLLSIAATLLVFVPDLGVEIKGARRWVDIGFVSFQPAEFLKIGFVIYFAAWLSRVRDKMHSFSYSVVPFVILLGFVGAILLAQPDTGTFIVIVSTGFVMFLVGGAKWRHVAAVVGLSVISAATLALTRPYVMERVLAFLDPSKDPLGSSYQIQQSLIAIGSGGLFGRGFGQSIQKFNFLPEPASDSIFAVMGEEFGFVGAVILISLFLALALRGLKIASRAPDYFSGLLVVGIVILITSQSFINIASMLGIFPLTGLPLLFVSHGGTAFFFVLFEVGIVLGISRYMRRQTPRGFS